MKSGCSASASTSVRPPRTWCFRASCSSGWTTATSSSERRLLHESEVMLTPYCADATIDAGGARPLHRAPVRAGGDRAAGDRHRRADPHRGRGPAQQCARDRRPVRRPGGQIRLGQRRRRARSDAGRVRLGRRGALDPRGGARHEHRHRRRHLEDRGVRARRAGRTDRRRHRRAHRLLRRATAGSPGSSRPARASPPKPACSSRSARFPIRRCCSTWWRRWRTG